MNNLDKIIASADKLVAGLDALSARDREMQQQMQRRIDEIAASVALPVEPIYAPLHTLLEIQ